MANYNYKPTLWEGGKTVGTADVMNNIENGIVNSYKKTDEVMNELNLRINETNLNVGNLSNSVNEIGIFTVSNNVSSVEPSYIIIGDLLICYGQVNVEGITSGERVTAPITFPKKFANSPFVSVSDNTSYANQVITTVGDITQTNCNVGLYTLSSSIPRKGLHWFAIGKKYS